MSHEAKLNLLNLKEIAKNTIKLSASLALSVNLLTIRAEAYPVLFANTNPNPQAQQPKYYADFNPKTKIFTGTKLSNPSIKGRVISPEVTINNGSKDFLQEYNLNGNINTIPEFTNTENLPIIDERFVPKKELCNPNDKGTGFQKLTENTGNMLPGTPVLQCAEYKYTTPNLVPIADTGLRFSQIDNQTGKPIFFKITK
jgi:hypothetical protein